MADKPTHHPTTGRLPEWWRTKPPHLPTDPPQTSTEPGRDWWDELYNDDSDVPPAPATDTDETETETPPTEATTSGWWTPQPGYYPHPRMPAFITAPPPRPALSPKTRAALYNASAAGAGWAFGLYGQFAGALTDCGTNYSISGALVLGAGGSLLIAHVWDRRTRHWWPGLAWAARIPLATALTALALWAPAGH